MRCSPMPQIATLPDIPPRNEDDGAALHYRALESLYASAPINDLFASKLAITERGRARIEFEVDERVYHAAGAAHGTIYFKMLDDAAFYAANSLVSDRFLLTTGFNLHFTAPIRAGKVVAEAHLLDADGEEIGRGTGTFMRSRIALAGLPGYTASNG